MNIVQQLQPHLNAGCRDTSNGASDFKSTYFITPCNAIDDKEIYSTILTTEALDFVTKLVTTFQDQIELLYKERKERRHKALYTDCLPHFHEETAWIRQDLAWKVDPIPEVLLDRRVDIGDVSPAETEFLIQALNSGAQGIQLDFDDGHCPNWRNQLKGHWNLFHAVRNQLKCYTSSGDLSISSAPALILVRPRTWNMDEMNMIVNGKAIPGALFDFGLHLFHNGKYLFNEKRGPFLYFPKLESHMEARLWSKILDYTEKTLDLPVGSIKGTVLIENIYAAFEMEEILYELRHHSSGLNCGMWDYCASILAFLGHRSEFLLPDRKKDVSMESLFLKSYMELLITTCQRRNAPATTGMVPFVLSQLPSSMTRQEITARIIKAKQMEADAGSNGALVFDIELVPYVQPIFSKYQKHNNELVQSKDLGLYEKALLTLPSSSISFDAVVFNLEVVFNYVLAWLHGKGTTILKGCLEDSATAEISRAQLTQWLRLRITIDSEALTMNVINVQLEKICINEERYTKSMVQRAKKLVLQLLTAKEIPSFITTFLYEHAPESPE